MPDRLTLEAELKDRLSPGIRNIKKELAGVGVTPGMNQATAWMGVFADKAESFARTGTNAGSVITAMGVGGLTAAASVAGLVAQMKELGERSLAMRELGRETGLATDYVNAFSHAGARFGVSADSMQSALGHLAEQMPQFKRGFGELHDQLAGRWPDFTKKLQLEGTEDQLRDIITQIGKIKDPQIQKSYLDLFFGNGADMEKLFQSGPKALLDELTRQQKTLAPITADMLKQAQTFRDAQVDFNTALENFERSAGPAFLGTMSGLLKDAKSFVETLDRGNEHGADRSPDHKDHRSWIEKGTDAARDVDGALGWLWQKFGDAARKTPDGDAALYHQQGFRGGRGGLLQLTSYGGGSGGGGGTAGLEDMLTSGVKEGTLAAFREMMAASSVGAPAGGGGLTLASLGGAGGGLGGGLGAGRRGGGGGGFDGPVPLGGKAGSLTKLIEDEARHAGIDPRIMEGIRAGESLHRGTYDKKDDAIESSWGPFQLNRRRGLGVQFEHDTGLDLRNPSSIAAQARWVAQYLKRGGSLGAWAGYRGPRNADPRWGESGYVPNPGAGERDAPGGPVAIGQRLRVLNEECVSLAKAAVGATGSVTEWRRGVGALAGTLKPGTPVATFMDSMGRLSDRYAGGGTGTRGVNRDHAAIFQSYIRDKAGNIVGMHVIEQSRGHPQHPHDYYSGGGNGERDARDYFGIKGADGSYLGGSRNPMNRRATGLAVHEHRGHGAPPPQEGGVVRAEVHYFGPSSHKTSIRSEGRVAASLHRWPTMTEASDSA